MVRNDNYKLQELTLLWRMKGGGVGETTGKDNRLNLL